MVWSDINKAILVWLYESNSTYSISKMFGLKSDESVRKKLIKLDIPRKGSGDPFYAIPSKKRIETVYPSKNLEDAAEHFGVKQTLFHKWVHHYGIKGTKKPRKPRSEAHKQSLSNSQKGRVYQDRRTGKNKPCATCGRLFYVSPPRLRQANTHYCSIKCKGISIRLEEFQKTCPECEAQFTRREGETAGNWQRRMYCSQDCAWKAAPPPVLRGESNPRFKGEDARKKQSREGQSGWRKAVLARDKYTCQHCNAKDVPLQAHHILSYEDFPDKRLDVDNGLTLCTPCHYSEHGWDLSENGIRVLVDDRGITTRRWVGSCLWCGEYLEKQASDMKRADGSHRIYAFCDKNCAMTANGFARRGLTKSEMKGFDITSVFEKWVAGGISNI